MTSGVEPLIVNIPHTLLPAPWSFIAFDSAPGSAPLISLILFSLLPTLSSYTVLITPAWPGKTIITFVSRHAEYCTMNSAH